MELKQSSIAIQKGEEDSLNVQQQKSFIGGVPTDNIIEVLDEPEEVIAGRLKDINQDQDPDRDILNLDSDD